MFFFYDIFKKVNFVFSQKPKSYLRLLALFIFLTFLELFSIGLLIPYLNYILNDDFALKTGSSILNFENFQIFTEMTKATLVIVLSTIFIVVFSFKTFFIIYVRAQIEKFSLQNKKKLKLKLMEGYQNMDYRDFVKKQHSEYIRNIWELSANATSCLEMSLRVISEIIVITAIVIFLLFIDPEPLFLIGLTIFLSLLFYYKFLKPLAVKWGKQKTEATELIYQSVDESFKGFKEIKSLEKQNFFIEFLRKGAETAFKNDLKSSIIIHSPRYFLELVLVLFIITFLSLNVRISGNDLNFLPTLAIFAMAGLRILPSAAIISNGILIIGYCTEALNLIYNDLQGIFLQKKNKLEKEKKINSHNFLNLKFKNLNFSYTASNKKIFENINFELEKYDKIGIIGTTGSGKTTLVDIILGLLKPNSGEIYLNDKQVNFNILNNLNKIGYLPQENFIINESIKMNITLSYDERQINNKKLLEVLDQLKLSETIDKLPDKINTIIGKSGVKLSGGQRQKISLARLLYHDKEILILDEATNALDKNSEKEVIKLLNTLKNKTILMISHDLENLKYCNKIYKVADKKLSTSQIK